MKSEAHVQRRTHYLVNKDFQLNFILKFCSIFLVGVVISTGLIYYFTNGTLTSSFQQSKLVIKSTAQSILPSVIYTNLITLALISSASILVTLFVSHKIVGPLIRFQKEVLEIGEGNLTKRISLRRKDQIEELKNSLNQMTESLHIKVLTIEKRMERLVESASDQNVPDEFILELKELHQTMETSFKL